VNSGLFYLGDASNLTANGCSRTSAPLGADIHGLNIQQCRKNHERWLKEVAMRSIDHDVGVACGYLRSMAEAELFVSGCHKHKSQWHLRRNPALPLMTFSAVLHPMVP
jgi:hypothetical protein